MDAQFVLVVLQQSGFVVEDYLFEHLILAFALVFEFEIIAKDAGQSLPKSRHELATKLLDNLVCCVFGLTVDKFTEDFSLVECHTFD